MRLRTASIRMAVLSCGNSIDESILDIPAFLRRKAS